MEKRGLLLELAPTALAAEVVGASGVVRVWRARRCIDDEAIEVAAVAADGTVLLPRPRRRFRRERGAAGEEHGQQGERADHFQKLIFRLLVTRKSVST
jgi:hypothetical protein